MPGLNDTGRPDTSDYTLGRGAVYFATKNATTGQPEAWRHMGNCSEFTISSETETLEHQTSRGGLKVTDKKVTVSQDLNLSFTLDEINFQNLALVFSGTADDTVTNPTQSGGGFTHTEGAAFDPGRWYDLRDDTDSSRGYDLNATSPISFGTPPGGGAAEGTDYELDYQMGRIFITPGGSLDGHTTTIVVAVHSGGAALLDTVDGLTASSTDGVLKFIAVNPASNDHLVEYQFHQVSVSPTGDLAMISDEWTTMQLEAAAEINTLVDTESPVKITTHANAN